MKQTFSGLIFVLAAALVVTCVSAQDDSHPPSEGSQAPAPEDNAETPAENDATQTDPAEDELEAYDFDEEEDEADSWLPPGTYLDEQRVLWPKPIEDEPATDDGSIALPAFTPVCEPPCTPGQGVCVAILDRDGEFDSQCSCFSGHSGNMCERGIPASCEDKKVQISPLAMAPGLKMDLFETARAGRLNVILSAPIVEHRVNMSFQIGVNTSNPRCKYPGPHWVKLPTQKGVCKDVIVSSNLLWGDILGCQLGKDFYSKPGQTAYKGRISVSIEDKTSFRGGELVPRRTNNVVSFSLNVPGYEEGDERIVELLGDIDKTFKYLDPNEGKIEL